MTKEYNKELVLQIRKIVEEHPKVYAYILKTKKSIRYLYEYIMEATKDFEELRFNERLYWLFVDLHEYPKCCVCHEKDISHKAPCNPIKGYLTHTCSQSCAQKNPEYRKRLLQHNNEKYGKDYPQQTDEYRTKQSEKLQAMPQEHWDNAREKREATCLKDYGVKNVMQNEEVAEKLSKILQNLDEEKRNDITSRTKKTKKKNHGDENYVNPQKALKTRHEKYGAFESQESKDKRKSTNIELRGVEHIMQDKTVVDKAIETRTINQRTKFYNEVICKNEFVEPLFSLSEYLENANSTLKWKCKKCGDIFECKKYEHQSHLARCLKCYPLLSGSSTAEKDLAIFIKNLGLDVVEGSRKIISPQEIDIYIPSKHIAIEYDGLYWHSIDSKGQDTYHYNKTIMCEKIGIQLIHVFENEWILKQDIVKAYLKSLFGMYVCNIDAKQCVIKEISNIEAKSFLNKNCIFDFVNANVSLGMFYNNELVYVMSFRKCRFDNNHEWELLRFCNKKGINVVNAKQLLIKHFENNYYPKSIICFENRRWYNGSFCKELNFKFVKCTQPNYWYWKYDNANLHLEASNKYSKNNQEKLFENFNNELTEYQNMANNGYLRIFDSGNLVFEKTYQ